MPPNICASKEVSKEVSKVVSKEVSKGASKEVSKEVSKETKETHEVPKVLELARRDLRLEHVGGEGVERL